MSYIAIEQARRITYRRVGYVSASILLIIAAIALGVTVGETSMPLHLVGQTLANKMLGASYALDPIDAGIIWNYRLTRAIVAAFCGASLSISGVVLQAMLRNALADPYILGISAGASTGAVTVLILGLGGGLLSLSLGAFAGSLVSFVLVVMLARAAGGGVGIQATGLIILSGIAGSQLFNALTSFIITRSANAEQVRGVMFWLMGNLSGVRWDDVMLAVPISTIGICVCIWHRRELDAFTFGADSAASLGVPVRKVQAIVIGAAAMMTAVMVSIVGSIGFVGIVIPHAARFLVGPRHAHLLPVAALMGGVFLVLADIGSRILVPNQVLPIGVITALVGAPGFALILIRRRRTR